MSSEIRCQFNTRPRLVRVTLGVEQCQFKIIDPNVSVPYANSHSPIPGTLKWVFVHFVTLEHSTVT